jgi:hypothetical protein
LAEICQEPLNLSFSSDTGDVEVEAAAEPPILSPIRHSSRQQSDAPISTLAPIPQYGSEAPGHMDNGQRSRSPLVAHSSSDSNRSSLTLETRRLQETSDAPSCLPPLLQNHREKELHVKSEPSSDTPVVVSERPVRKRKHASGDEGDMITSIKLKVEYSPEPQCNDERRCFSPQESIDFNTECHRVETPRKHNRYQRAQDVQHEDVNVEGYNHNDRIMHPINTIGQDIRNPARDVSITDLTASRNSEPQNNVISALRPLNNNEVLRPRPNLPLSRRNRKSSTMSRGLASLAEDSYQNEEFNPTNSKNGSRVSVLERLLNMASPIQESETLRSGSSVENRLSSDPYFQPTQEARASFRKRRTKEYECHSKRQPECLQQ